jgi:catechol 2,3-dioxygenase-like lactoylglutathione lyase family enzyme
MSTNSETTSPTRSAPRWRGINHLALITTDMDATVRFYVGVLGTRLVATIGTPAFRHYFFEFGQGTTVAFFEYTDIELATFAKPAGVPHPSATQFDHLSFDLVDEDALLELRSRLKEANCEVTDIVDHGFIRSIYFTDPSGIALEASCWINDPTGQADLSFDDSRVFVDPNPVPAVQELRRDGHVAHVPASKLVDGYTQRTDDWVAPA